MISKSAIHFWIVYFEMNWSEVKSIVKRIELGFLIQSIRKFKCNIQNGINTHILDNY